MVTVEDLPYFLSIALELVLLVDIPVRWEGKLRTEVENRLGEKREIDMDTPPIDRPETTDVAGIVAVAKQSIQTYLFGTGLLLTIVSGMSSLYTQPRSVGPIDAGFSIVALVAVFLLVKFLVPNSTIRRDRTILGLYLASLMLIFVNAVFIVML